MIQELGPFHQHTHFRSNSDCCVFLTPGLIRVMIILDGRNTWLPHLVSLEVHTVYYTSRRRGPMVSQALPAASNLPSISMIIPITYEKVHLLDV